VAGGSALHFARGDVEALTHALSRIIDDTDLRISLIRKGPARAAQFTWERSASAHLAVYREAAR
jgi:alpha-1,3-rhamnosyl/mannosyltransferase